MLGLDSEVFVADRGCNLFALDMRNGRIVYGYKGQSKFRAAIYLSISSRNALFS